LDGRPKEGIMSGSKILFYFCLSFIGGIFLSSIEKDVIPIGFFYVFFLGIFFISLFRKNKNLLVFGFCIFFLLAGILRHQITQSKIEENLLKNYFGEKVEIIGIVDEEPKRKENITQLKVKIEGTNEKVLITKWHYPDYKYGDRLKIKGVLQAPKTFEGFNYKNYLAKDGIFALMWQPEIELLEKNKGSSFKNFLISLKNRLKETSSKILPFPQAPFSEALLFGEEGFLSEKWKAKLNITGTRHIAAVSGMNITILTFLISDFLLRLGFWRKEAFCVSLVLIFLYILMIGAPPSAIRAGIMASLFLIAQYFGRLAASSRTIVLACTIMLILNPLLLTLDIGFQLSFLAVMGLIYLQPILFEFFKKIPNSFQLRYNLSGTLAAQIFTFPLLIYNFGQISLISPITNILILPTLPFATILSFIFSAIGIVSETLGQIFSLPAYFLLTYLIKIVDFFSKIPLSSLSLQNVSSSFLFSSYLILGLIVFYLNKKQELKFLNY